MFRVNRDPWRQKKKDRKPAEGAAGRMNNSPPKEIWHFHVEECNLRVDMTCDISILPVAEAQKHPGNDI